MWISDNDTSQYSSYGAEMPANTGEAEAGMAYPAMAMYPAVYYILQPHILVACDQMDMCGCMMPSPHMMMHMCDQIGDMVLKMHPEMAQYDAPYPVGTMVDPPMGFPGGFGGFPDGFGRFRRRTPFRDLIFFLLLAELFRRRRRF